MGFDALVYATGPDIGELAGRLAIASTERALEYVGDMAAAPEHVEPEWVSEAIDALHYPKTERMSPMSAAVLAYTRNA